jgi:hypothetical protein
MGGRDPAGASSVGPCRARSGRAPTGPASEAEAEQPFPCPCPCAGHVRALGRDRCARHARHARRARTIDVAAAEAASRVQAGRSPMPQQEEEAEKKEAHRNPCDGKAAGLVHGRDHDPAHRAHARGGPWKEGESEEEEVRAGRARVHALDRSGHRDAGHPSVARSHAREAAPVAVVEEEENDCASATRSDCDSGNDWTVVACTPSCEGACDQAVEACLGEHADAKAWHGRRGGQPSCPDDPADQGACPSYDPSFAYVALVPELVLAPRRRDETTRRGHAEAEDCCWRMIVIDCAHGREDPTGRRRHAACP